MRFKRLGPAVIIILTLIGLKGTGIERASGSALLIQRDEISQLLQEASDLEVRAAKLRQAVENCRRRITPQAPDCSVYVEWMKTVVPYQEAEKIALALEDQARQKRNRAEFLKSQLNPPPPPTNVQTGANPAATTGAVNISGQGGQQNMNQATPVTPVPPPTTSSPAPVPGVGEVRIGGLTQREWNRLRDYQSRIDELSTKWPLSREETDELDRLEMARNRLWKKAVSVPGLTAEERQHLRLLLHTRNQTAEIPVLRKENIQNKRKTSPPPPPFPAAVLGEVVESHMEVGSQQALDEFGKDMVEVINIKDVDRKMLNGENVVGVSRISLKLKEKDYPGAIAETFDFVVGKLVLPLTSMNVNVFKSVYSKVTFGALNKFMEDSMKAVGGTFSWDEMTKDMTTGQKAVMDWVGLGDLMKDKKRESE